MSDLAEKLAGKFIVLDGPDGSGKTTQLRRLRDHLVSQGARVEVLMDPGTTKIGRKIRLLLLDRDNGEMGPMCETLLFMASRAQLICERVRPAIEARKVVLCDRFISATVAYQGASGVDKELVIELGRTATEGLWPDITVILDIPVSEGMKRLGVTRERLKQPRDEEMQKLGASPAKRKKSPKRPEFPGQMLLFGDRLEHRSSEYHERVRHIFLDLGKLYPARVQHLDATGTKDEVFERLLESLSREDFKA